MRHLRAYEDQLTASAANLKQRHTDVSMAELLRNAATRIHLNLLDSNVIEPSDVHELLTALITFQLIAATPGNESLDSLALATMDEINEELGCDYFKLPEETLREREFEAYLAEVEDVRARYPNIAHITF